MNLKVVVIGVTHHNTLGIVRCVGRAGCRVDYLIMTDGKGNSFVSRSRYVKKTISIDGPDKLANLLMEIKRKEDANFVILPCTDSSAHVLDMNYEIFKKRFYFFNACEQGRMTRFMNKQAQTVLAEKAGLAVPWSKEYVNVKDDVVYPCILKPVQSINGGKQIVICENETALASGIVAFGSRVDVLVQEYIKKDAEIVVLGVSTQNGITIPGYILKHREHDGGTTYSTVCDVNDLPKRVLNGCKDLVASIHYTGLFGIEFLKCKDQYYFVEINLRNDATTYALAIAGANLPKMYIDSFMHPSINNATARIKRITSMVEYNDFKHRRENGISLFLWLRQYISAKCKYYFSILDPLPFFYAPFK